MGTVDVYRITNTLDETTLDVLVARLESRGKHPRFSEMMRDYMDNMAIDSAKSVLDLGCGTGVAARTIARRPDFSGKVTGIDHSSHLIAAATRLAKEERIENRVEFRSGDSHSLALRDATFDHCTINIIVLRFWLYFVSTVALWFIAIRAALRLL